MMYMACSGCPSSSDSLSVISTWVVGKCVFSSLSESWRSRHSRINALQMRSVQSRGRHRGDFVPSQAVKTLAAGDASDVRSVYNVVASNQALHGGSSAYRVHMSQP
ncbi:unnamed protein product [Cercospora beticola]|nr:unnamed protein product [Cercospora beticola]